MGVVGALTGLHDGDDRDPVHACQHRDLDRDVADEHARLGGDEPRRQRTHALPQAGVPARDPVQVPTGRDVGTRVGGRVVLQADPLARPVRGVGERGQPGDLRPPRRGDRPGAGQVSRALVVDVVADHAAGSSVVAPVARR